MTIHLYIFFNLRIIKMNLYPNYKIFDGFSKINPLFLHSPSMPQSHMQDYFSWGPNTQCSFCPGLSPSLTPLSQLHSSCPSELRCHPALTILPQTPPRMENSCTALDFCDSLCLHLCTYTVFIDQFR